MTTIAGCGSESGSISQRHGSADLDPDPHQNVTDPEHWFLCIIYSMDARGGTRYLGNLPGRGVSPGAGPLPPQVVVQTQASRLQLLQIVPAGHKQMTDQ